MLLTTPRQKSEPAESSLGSGTFDKEFAGDYPSPDKRAIQRQFKSLGHVHAVAKSDDGEAQVVHEV